MKKIVVFFLALSFIFCITGCSDKDKDSNKVKVDIEYYANLGQIPECEYPLGTSVDTFKEETTTESVGANHTHEGIFYNVTEYDDYVFIESNAYSYFYLKDKKAEGVSYIVSYDTAFGFEIGTVSIEIKEAIGDTNHTTEQLTKENAFFMRGMVNGELIKCKYDKNTVIFVIQDNVLCATAIYRNSDWE